MELTQLRLPLDENRRLGMSDTPIETGCHRNTFCILCFYRSDQRPWNTQMTANRIHGIAENKVFEAAVAVGTHNRRIGIPLTRVRPVFSVRMELNERLRFSTVIHCFGKSCAIHGGNFLGFAGSDNQHWNAQMMANRIDGVAKDEVFDASVAMSAHNHQIGIHFTRVAHDLAVRMS